MGYANHSFQNLWKYQCKKISSNVGLAMESYLAKSQSSMEYLNNKSIKEKLKETTENQYLQYEKQGCCNDCGFEQEMP